MKKILIINLRRLGDVFSTAHLVNSLSNNGENKISILTYKESAGAAKSIKGLSHIFEIDRKEIITLKTNKLFSDGFALEKFFNQVKPIKNQEWDQVINYSNDPVGTYITSYLKSSALNIVGTHYSEERNIITKNDWEILFNDILPTIKYSPIHFVDCYHRMSGVSLVREGNKLNTRSDYNEVAFNNINNIRKTYSNGSDSGVKVVGIQIKTADTSKDIPEKTLHELIKLIQKNSLIVPILLIAPTEEERRYANNLNESYGNSLIVVEADLEALGSVLINIDLLVTPDTAVKHVADLVETPVLEISLGHAPFLKQGSYSAESLILTDLITKREFKKEQATNITTNIKASDIMASILFLLTKSKVIKPRLSEDVTLYQASFDQLGIRYTPIAGAVNTPIEIHRLMTRQLLNTLFDPENAENFYTDAIALDLASAHQWATTEKAIVTNVMKDLLGTLRSLLQCTENRKSSREFVINLGKLISHPDQNSMVQIPVSMFKSKLEHLKAKTFEENTKEVEILLYELKSDMQKILLCLKQLDEHINTKKVEEMITPRNLDSTKI